MNRKPSPRLCRSILGLAGLAVLFCACGAGCPNVVAQYQQPLLPALPPRATLEDVMAVVNNNSARIKTLYSTDATISAPWFPTLKARLAYQRPGRFRLLARTSLSGPEIDLGSNEELFWVWIARTKPPQTYFCRHNQFAGSPARRAFPVEPSWLLEAIGITRLDPLDEHRGPTLRDDGRLEIRTLRRDPSGEDTTKITVVDAQKGWVVEQRLYDRQGVLLATSEASEHHRDPITDAVLPAHVKLEWPAARMSLKVNLGDVEINRDELLANHLWTMPDYPGYELVNLADPNLRFEPPQQPPATRARQTVVHRLPLDWLDGLLRR